MTTERELTVHQAGFIAQEVQQIPELAHAVLESDGMYSLNYNSIFTHAVAAIKELDAVVKAQASTIASLESRVSKLTSMFDAWADR